MITPNALGTPRPTIGHTTISKQPPNIRLPTAPRLVNTGGIRTQIPSLQVPGQAVSLTYHLFILYIKFLFYENFDLSI